MNSTIELKLPALGRMGPTAATRFLDRLLRSMVEVFEGARQDANSARAELLRRADAYESTQPSYAADLRAAAYSADIPR
jgi:hypothetical protein